MKRSEYLKKYQFNWEAFDVIAGGRSSLDAETYIDHLTSKEDVESFLVGYGFDINDPIQSAELFGNFQEAIQFIKRYFLKDGNPEGFDFSIPSSLFMVTDVATLFLMATGHRKKEASVEESIWAGIILKVMHTILHADKDLRYRYFSTIQQQVLDRFYKFLYRDDQDLLYLGTDSNPYHILLHDFETKAKKTRESIIIKLLHKRENVAEELFDRIGVRFITKDRVDALRVVKFLYDNYVIMVNNIKPSRSHNSLVDLDCFRKSYYVSLKNAIKNDLSEEQFFDEVNELAKKCEVRQQREKKSNQFTSENYRAIHFTCRQLIKYRNPFLKSFNKLKNLAKSEESSELAQQVLALDTSSVTSDVRFFYPFEVQITDLECHKKNTEGDASHEEYKRQQQISAMKRLFQPLLQYKGFNE